MCAAVPCGYFNLFQFFTNQHIEITVLVGLSCNEGSDELAKMRMIVRVPPKDQGEVRLIVEKEYGIASETYSLNATDLYIKHKSLLAYF